MLIGHERGQATRQEQFLRGPTLKGAVPLTEDTRTIVEMLADHESALKDLYQAYAAKIPLLKDLWLKLAEDEQRHSNWLGSLVSKVGADDPPDPRGWPRPAAVASSLKYIRAQIIRAQQTEVTLLVALSIARDLESALLEQELLKVPHGASPEVHAVFGRLVAETKSHRRTIVQALDAAKRGARTAELV